MLACLFLRYLSDKYEAAARRELGRDYPKLPDGDYFHEKADLDRLLSNYSPALCESREAFEERFSHHVFTYVGENVWAAGKWA